MSLQFTIEPKQANETLEAFITRTINQNSGEFRQGTIVPDVKRTVTVDGRNALWYQGNLGPAVKHTEVYIPKDDTTVVVISVFTGEALITGGNGAMTLSNAHRGLLELMLANFKFINTQNTVTTNNFQTYTNASLGLSFQYPANWITIPYPPDTNVDTATTFYGHGITQLPYDPSLILMHLTYMNNPKQLSLTAYNQQYYNTNVPIMDLSGKTLL